STPSGIRDSAFRQWLSTTAKTISAASRREHKAALPVPTTLNRCDPTCWTHGDLTIPIRLCPESSSTTDHPPRTEQGHTTSWISTSSRPISSRYATSYSGMTCQLHGG